MEKKKVNRKTKQRKPMKQKPYFESINKIDKLLARLTKINQKI